MALLDSIIGNTGHRHLIRKAIMFAKGLGWCFPSYYSHLLTSVHFCANLSDPLAFKCHLFPVQRSRRPHKLWTGRRNELLLCQPTKISSTRVLANVVSIVSEHIYLFLVIVG